VGKVVLSRDSDSGLIADNGKIRGLAAGKYYKIEKQNKDSAAYTFLGYIRSNGTRSSALENIGRVIEGTEINGLENFEVYRVQSAKYAANSQKIIIICGESSKEHNPDANGIITLPKSDASYFMDISGFITASALEVLAIPAGGKNGIINPTADGLYKLGNQNSTTDYIFVEKNGGEITGFNVLTIKINPPLAIKIEFKDDDYIPQNNDPVLYSPEITVKLSQIYSVEGKPVTITVTNAEDFLDNSFVWLIKGVQIFNNSSELLIDFRHDMEYNDTRDDLFAVGVHTITVRAQTLAGIFYSQDIMIEVTDD